jgi:hypothetical protein
VRRELGHSSVERELPDGERGGDAMVAIQDVVAVAQAVQLHRRQSAASTQRAHDEREALVVRDATLATRRAKVARQLVRSTDAADDALGIDALESRLAGWHGADAARVVSEAAGTAGGGAAEQMEQRFHGTLSIRWSANRQCPPAKRQNLSISAGANDYVPS